MYLTEEAKWSHKNETNKEEAIWNLFGLKWVKIKKRSKTTLLISYRLIESTKKMWSFFCNILKVFASYRCK